MAGTMDKHYTVSNRNGIYTAGSDCVTVVGQVAGCDIQIVNHTEYEDEILAKIIPNREKDGWHIVKVTGHWPILINGVEMNRVHYLADGDVIDFSNAHCVFNIKDGRQAEPTIVHIHKNSKKLWVLFAAIMILCVTVGWRIYSSGRYILADEQIAEIETSLFSTRVDSIQLLRGDSVIESYAYASSPIGTAFLTTDSLIVTARHCIQPWLNKVLPYEYASIPGNTEWPIKKALFVETENQLSGNDEYRLRAWLTLTDENDNSFTLTSDDFRINRDYDDIVELGTYDTPQYWRSISHRYHRTDMMLGDIAYAKSDRPGRIALASEEDIRKMLRQRRTKLYFFGHPESGIGNNSLDIRADELRMQGKELEGTREDVFMLAHDGDLTPGFSGGPAIMRSGSGFKAVGVISVTDERNGHLSYSVPTSEIIKLQR